MTNSLGFADLVGPDSILLDLSVATKAELFERLALVAADASGVAATIILERVRERETLGATGFGQGAAIPHARLEGLASVIAVIARLVRGVDYGALDGEPVDSVVLLLSPEGAGADHLKALAKISRALRDPVTLAAMRAAGDTAAMRTVIGGALVGQPA